MELTQIRYFLEVAETQHMTASAERLHIAQPALSQAIRRLENELGVPLFAPKGRNIVLTPYGKYLQQQLIPLMQQLDKLPEMLHTMAQLECETIHLNVLTASTLVTDAIILYKNAHSDLNFQLLQNAHSDIFDIEINTHMFYQVKPERMRDQFVCAEKIFLAVPNNEKYAGRTSIRLEEVAEEGFISLMGSRQFRAICDKFCRQAGVRPNIIFESDNLAAVKNMIAANLGVGFWPEFTWGRLDTGRVLLLEIANTRCSRDIVITLNRNKVDNSRVEAFFDFLKAYFSTRQTEACKGFEI